MGHGPKKGKKAAPYLLGSAMSGVLEIGIFHPVDTCAKRLMSNKTQVSGANVRQVVFGDAAGLSMMGRVKSLYPGVGFGAAYKILQRSYKFGMQPILKSAIDRKHGESFRRVFGNKNGQDLMHACAGSMVGLGEVALLPLDVLKIKAQTNPAVLSGRGVGEIVRSEGLSLYRGWNWTAMRNMPGSFALFGATSLVYSRVFNIEKDTKKTLFQTFCGSFAGGVASIAVSSPMDVIKVRVQSGLNSGMSGTQVLTNLIKQEGAGALFKGMTPKIGLIGPKLVFSWTVAQLLSDKLAENWPQ